ncbi:MAG: hypothetical protein AAF922_06490 [Pseudomonadota bacterium]
MKQLAIALSVLLVSAQSWATETIPSGPVIITVAGNIEAINRGPVGPDDLTLFRVFGVEFNRGYELDRDMLASLKQASITATVPGTEAETGVFSGPLLGELATLVGGSEKVLAPLALDGYQLDITPELIAAHDPILATHHNGVPLSLGEFGPAMVIFPDQTNPELEEELNALEVWAVFYIEVR